MDELLNEILDDPEKIAELTGEQLSELRGKLAAMADSIDPETATAEDVEALEAATVLASSVDERIAALDAEKTERLEKVSALKDRLVPRETEPEPEPEGEVEVEVPDTPAELVEQESVTAAKLSSIKTLIPKESQPKEPAVKITGPNGKALSNRAEYGRAAMSVWEGLGSYRPTAGFELKQVASLEQHRHRYSMTQDPDQNAEVLDKLIAEEQRAAKAGLMAGEALTAAFCAPNEPIYTFFNIATRAGLLNLPSVNADRGGFRIPTSFSLGDVLGQTGIAFEWDAATDASPGVTTKPVFEVDCPEIVDCEVSAWVTRLRFRNTVRRFWPELYAHITELALVAAARTVNAARIASLQAFATAVTTTASTAGSAVEIASRVGVAGYNYREREGMSPEATLDVVFPAYVLDLMVADLIARGSTTEYGNARARVSALFGSLNLRAQFVYDYLDLTAANAAATEALIFAPGTAILADAGVLNLGEVRDSTLNSTNRYETFVESFETVCFPGHRIDEVTLDLCDIGATASLVDTTCGASDTP